MSELPQTRFTLILRLKTAEDAGAWSEFIDIYQPLIIRLATAKGLQPADAQDVAQEVLSKIAKAINQFDPHPDSGSFRGWISRITRNMVIDFLRSKKRTELVTNLESITSLYEATTPMDSNSALFDLEHERQMFIWAAEKIKGGFTNKTWTAFWQTAVENRSVAEVAKQLKLSSGAIYIARSRVMAKLKTTIDATQFDSGSFLKGKQR